MNSRFLPFFILLALIFYSYSTKATEHSQNKPWIISQTLENVLEDIKIKDVKNALESIGVSAVVKSFEQCFEPYEIIKGDTFTAYIAPTFYSQDHIWILANSNLSISFETLTTDQLKELEKLRYLIGEIYTQYLGYQGYAMLMDLKKEYGLGYPTFCLEMIPTSLAGPQRNELDVKEKIERTHYILFNSGNMQQLSLSEAKTKIALFKTFLTKLQANNQTLSVQRRNTQNTLPWKRKVTHIDTLQHVCLLGLEQEFIARNGVFIAPLNHSHFQKPQKSSDFKQEGGEFTNAKEKDTEIKKCAFCNPKVIGNQLVYRQGDFDCIYNFRPYTLGYHFMITPHPPLHVENWQNFSLQDVLQIDQLAQAIVKALKQESGRDDVILFIQNGLAAGMTVPHGHMHILLRPSKLHFYAQVLLEITPYGRKGLTAEEMKPVKEKFKKRLHHLLLPSFRNNKE